MAGQRLSTLALCCAAAVAVPAAAVAVPAAALAGLEPTTRWDPKLDEQEARLEVGKYAAAQRSLRSLRERMVREAASFEADPRTLARATALLAVAEAGLEDYEAAQWHWHAAHSLDRRAVPGDLGRFGAAGAWLIERPPRRAGDLPASMSDQTAASPGAHVVRSGASRAEALQRPVGMCGILPYVRDRVPPPMVIEVLVDGEGRPHDPVLIAPTRFAGFAAAALDSVRHWRFEPARSADGDPVATLAQVRVEHPRN